MNWTEFELLTKEQLYEMVTELEEKVKDLEYSNDELDADISDLSYEVDDLKNDIIDLKARLREAEDD